MHKHLSCSREDHHHAPKVAFEQPPCSVCHEQTFLSANPSSELPSLSSCLLKYLKAKPNPLYDMWIMRRAFLMIKDGYFCYPF